MTPGQYIWAVLIVAHAIVATLHALSLKGSTTMSVIAAVQAELDKIPAQVSAAVAAALSQAPLPEGAASAQDVDDTVEAVKAGVASINPATAS